MNSDKNFFFGDFRWCQESEHFHLHRGEEEENNRTTVRNVPSPPSPSTESHNPPSTLNPNDQEILEEFVDFYDVTEAEKRDDLPDYLEPICFPADLFMAYLKSKGVSPWRRARNKIVLCDQHCEVSNKYTSVRYPLYDGNGEYNEEGRYNVYVVTRFVRLSWHSSAVTNHFFHKPSYHKPSLHNFFNS